MGLGFDLFQHTTTRGTSRLVRVNGPLGVLPDLLASALPASVDVRLSTRVERIAIEDGVAVGVVVDGELVPASDVVIASGGFAGSRDVLEAVLGVSDGDWHVSPVIGGTGDAIRWAETEGWSVSHRDAIGRGYASMAAQDGDSVPVGVSFDPDGLHPWIWIAETGARFFDETAVWSLVAATAVAEHTQVWGVSPEAALLDALNGAGALDWDTMLAEGERAFCADSLVTLAPLIGVDAGTLAAEGARIAQVRALEVDDTWGRPAASFPDYSAGAVCAWRPARVAIKTFGGLDVDGDGRVFDASGVPIPHLYAVGEAAGMAAPGTGGAHGFDGSLAAVTWSGWRAGTLLAHSER